MTGYGSSKRQGARAVLLAALAAMILRALLPAGFMPEPGSGKIVICTGKGLAEIPAGDHGKAPPSAPDGTCLFSTSAHAAPPPAPQLLGAVAFVFDSEIGLAPSQTVAPGRGLAAPPPPAHAPPILI